MAALLRVFLLVSCVFWTSAPHTAESRAVVPSYMKICQKMDPHINDCIKDSLQKLLLNLKNGVENLNVPAIDPLSLPHLTLKLGEGDVSLKMTMDGVAVSGLSQAEVLSVKANVEDGKFEISTRTPELAFSGRYSAEGGVHRLPLGGQGEFNVTLTDVTSIWMVYYHTGQEVMTPERLFPHTVDGNSTVVAPLLAIEVDAFALDLMPSKASYHFDHFLDGDNGLGNAVNSFLNENAHEVFNDIKSQLLQQMGKTFADVANSLLINFSEDQVLM